MITSILNIKTLVATFVISLFVGLALSPTASAALFDGAKEDACAGANLRSNSPGNCGDKAAKTLTARIQDFINLFSIIIGIVAVIMIIVAGLRYVTAGGDANSIGSAKNTLIYAVIGLIVAALAQIIVRFVLGEVT
jgi:hypothetical protein